MGNKIVLAFDMDNTVCDTNGEVLKRFKEYCVERKEMGMLEYIEKNEGVSISYWDKEVVKFIEKVVIEKREYMDTPELSELGRSLKGLVGDLRGVLKEDLKIVVCTHRGNNVSAWMSTYNYLVKNGLLECFDMIHSISHVDWSNKIEFLKSNYRDSEILLVDDNPFGSKSRVYDFCKEVLVYGEYDNFDCYKNQNCYKGCEDLFERVVGLN